MLDSDSGVISDFNLSSWDYAVSTQTIIQLSEDVLEHTMLACDRGPRQISTAAALMFCIHFASSSLNPDINKDYFAVMKCAKLDRWTEFAL